MNIQIFGLKKCFDTQKTERYFKERKIQYQFIDLKQKGLSKGELESVRKNIELKDLINPKAKGYAGSNIEQIRSAAGKEEILLNHPALFKTPIVRNGKLATVGYQAEVWKDWE
ncbi:arsenate reductase like protein [Syntrophobotulus glycolicus DSM 8271]|uniref:Arsenate reductase like protein n=1 Tax=Syntrophobotulus glycolicus (strain DSM 8271 / FlGlyR) TaxID=645991 RepID=F0SYB5_SYNGF|nr:arsenate reductase family protein [Syntrophobotulus glycolicus]ADY55950.1 arsenate reductase like protein [Syntrophobotulus glycolicus DSM 8271]